MSETPQMQSSITEASPAVRTEKTQPGSFHLGRLSEQMSAIRCLPGSEGSALKLQGPRHPPADTTSVWTLSTGAPSSHQHSELSVRSAPRPGLSVSTEVLASCIWKAGVYRELSAGLGTCSGTVPCIALSTRRRGVRRLEAGSTWKQYRGPQGKPCDPGNSYKWIGEHSMV